MNIGEIRYKVETAKINKSCFRNHLWASGIERKGDRVCVLLLSACEAGGARAYLSKFVGALYVGYWAVDEHCSSSVSSPECTP